ncbi:MAG: hypothetical protein UV60_C0025G0007 [Parcubacteria group bacterium GW2011_GWA2_43_11]|nr:MAG: hypothetical protein UV60_C0025G0007 [Parcubacteria group bacterium GW2011_GWA2_43_11]
MKKNYLKIVLGAGIISLVGVWVIDYLAHWLFSNPMETMPYFMVKLALYFVFSILFLLIIKTDKNELLKVVVAGIIVALLFGFYYNIISIIMDKLFDIYFYPFGIALNSLSFLRMGLLGTGLAFGTVHTLVFIGGYYSSKFVLKNL